MQNATLDLELASLKMLEAHEEEGYKRRTTTAVKVEVSDGSNRLLGPRKMKLCCQRPDGP